MQQRFFHDIIQDEVLIDNRLIMEIVEVTERFPFCQSAHLMLAKAMQQNGHIDFSQTLQIAALYSGDRTRLQKHCQQAKHEMELRHQTAREEKMQRDSLTVLLSETPTLENGNSLIVTEKRKRLLDLIRNRISEIEEEKSLKTEIQKQKPASSKENSDNNYAVQLDNEALINDFLKAQPHIKPPINPKEVSEINSEIISDISEEVVSETLADIYIKQGHLEKARQSFEKLSLKFPEKSSYFAARIKTIENN